MGNDHAVKSGLRQTILLSTMTPEERAEYADAQALDRLTHISEAIALASIREGRMMQRIAKLRDDAGEMSLVQCTRGNNKKLGEHWEDKSSPTLDRIQAIEADLTTLQKTKAGLVKQAQEIETARGGAGDDEPIDRLFDALAASRAKHEGR